MMNYFEIKNLHMSYEDDKPVLSDLSLSMTKGEVATLLGGSGIGKSTLFRIIAGLLKPNKGFISLDDSILNDTNLSIAPHKRGVGMVFQNYALFPHMTVAQNVAYGLQKDKERRLKVKEALASVSMIDYLTRYPHELSGGQQQRVAIARTIATAPKLLLLDEPFSNLDAQLTSEVTILLQEIIAMNEITTIIISHRPEEVKSITHRYYEMQSGQLLPVKI